MSGERVSGFRPATGEPPTFGMDEDGRHFWWSHDCIFHTYGRGEDITRRAGPQMLPLGGNGWSVVQTEPLTVSPSILCSGCNTHGFIRDGKWVEA